MSWKSWSIDWLAKSQARTKCLHWSMRLPGWPGVIRKCSRMSINYPCKSTLTYPAWPTSNSDSTLSLYFCASTTLHPSLQSRSSLSWKTGRKLYRHNNLQKKELNSRKSYPFKIWLRSSAPSCNLAAPMKSTNPLSCFVPSVTSFTNPATRWPPIRLQRRLSWSDKSCSTQLHSICRSDYWTFTLN